MYTGLEEFLNCDADWLDPLAAPEMERLADLFGGDIPDQVRWLYERTGGCFNITGKPLLCRLLPIQQVEEMNARTPTLIGSPVWLFADELGDCVGVYSSDVVRGFVTAWEHETLDFSPRWKDVSVFLETMMQADSAYGLACVPTEFPVSNEHAGPESKLAVEFIERAESSADGLLRADVLRFAARMMTAELARRMLPFVSSGDMQCAEIAATELARWRVNEAVPAIGKACREHDSYLLLEALQIFKTAESRAIVDAIHSESRESFKRATRGGSA